MEAIRNAWGTRREAPVNLGGPHSQGVAPMNLRGSRFQGVSKLRHRAYFRAWIKALGLKHLQDDLARESFARLGVARSLWTCSYHRRDGRFQASCLHSFRAILNCILLLRGDDIKHPFRNGWGMSKQIKLRT